MACKLIECVQVHCTRSPLLCALRNTRCSVRLTNFMNSAKKKKQKKNTCTVQQMLTNGAINTMALEFVLFWAMLYSNRATDLSQWHILFKSLGYKVVLWEVGEGGCLGLDVAPKANHVNRSRSRQVIKAWIESDSRHTLILIIRIRLVGFDKRPCCFGFHILEINQ